MKKLILLLLLCSSSLAAQEVKKFKLEVTPHEFMLINNALYFTETATAKDANQLREELARQIKEQDSTKGK